MQSGLQTGVDESTQLRVVQENLLRAFGDRVPGERIRAEVVRGMVAYRGARIRTFIPVLLQRQVADALRRVA